MLKLLRLLREFFSFSLPRVSTGGEWMGKEERHVLAFFTAMVLDVNNIRVRRTPRPMIFVVVREPDGQRMRTMEDIAQKIGASIIDADEIHLDLTKRKECCRQERAIQANTRFIVNQLVFKVLNKNTNVVLGWSSIFKKERLEFEKKLEKLCVGVAFIEEIVEVEPAIEKCLEKMFA